MNAKVIRAPAATNIAQMEPMLPQARELEKLLSTASELREKPHQAHRPLCRASAQVSPPSCGR